MKKPVLLISANIPCEERLARRLKDVAALKRVEPDSRTKGTGAEWRAVVVDTRLVNAVDAMRVIGGARSRHQDVPVVVYVRQPWPAALHRHLPMHWAADPALNVSIIVEDENDDVAGIVRAIAVAEATIVWNGLLPFLVTTETAHARRVLRAAVEGACANLSVEELAAMFGMRPRTLQVELRDLRLPSPVAFIESGRVLFAAWALLRGRTLDELQLGLGLASPQTLRDEVR